MKTLAMILLATAVLTAPASAKEMDGKTAAQILSTRTMLNTYTTGDKAARGAIESFVGGVAAGLQAASFQAEVLTGEPLYCFPNNFRFGANAAIPLLRAMVRKDNRALDQHVAIALAAAVGIEYACPSGERS